MPAVCFVVSILFSIHHNERVCHFSHGKQSEYVTCDRQIMENVFAYVVFFFLSLVVNKSEQ